MQEPLLLHPGRPQGHRQVLQVPVPEAGPRQRVPVRGPRPVLPAHGGGPQQAPMGDGLELRPGTRETPPCLAALNMNDTFWRQMPCTKGSHQYYC